MDVDALKELFAPFGAVAVKRMFGGHGVYRDGLCFALEVGGEVFLKIDVENEAAFSAAGSSPFVYQARERAMTVAYWRLPSAAYDEADELRRWAALGFDAALRAAAAKTAKAKSAGAKPKGASTAARPKRAAGARAASPRPRAR